MCIMLADVLVLCNMFEQSIAFPVALLIGWLNGMGYSGAGIFTGAIYADCMEYDELYSGKRREAQYDATWVRCAVECTKLVWLWLAPADIHLVLAENIRRHCLCVLQWHPVCSLCFCW